VHYFLALSYAQELMARSSVSAQCDLVASYMDGVHVKIAEAYKPPRKIGLPAAYNNRLPDVSKLVYDFSLEKSVLEKVRCNLYFYSHDPILYDILYGILHICYIEICIEIIYINNEDFSFLTTSLVIYYFIY